MNNYKFTILLFFISALSFSQENTVLKWWNPSMSETHVLSSQGWPAEVRSIYHRLPEKAEQQVRKSVWNLSKQSAGLSIRFWTNSRNIQVNYRLKGEIDMPHMPATGVSGLDLYTKSKHGQWSRCWGSYSIDSISNYKYNIEDKLENTKKYGREYQLFLPLYNEVDSLEIGVDEESFLEILPIRKEKPIVAYGTSICQGACASRPGMAWTNILERNLDRSIINLGFSGNGRLEPELIELMTEIDAKVYLLDCLPNLNPNKDNTYQLTINAVKALKEKRPNVPIILTEHIGYAHETTNTNVQESYQLLNKALNQAFQQLKTEGYTDIYLLQKEKLGLDYDSFVDSIHPNDYGMVQYAKAYEQLIREILHEYSGDLSTKTPKTQSRDIAVYKWENRHQQLLELNKKNPPKICLLGDSIIHFWGGEPTGTAQSGKDSWDQVMHPLGVRNFGFGWDRIENVLWRVHHEELDNFEADQIILMIGTNNLHLNSETEIIEGLNALVKAIQTRQPNSDILLIGILPRNGEEKKIEKLNLKIAQLADLEDISFKDIGHSLLLENGEIDTSLFSDGLHPNNKGYWKIAKNLERFIVVD